MNEQDQNRKSLAASDRRRRKVTLIAAAATLVLLAAMVWLVQLLVEQQRIERCIASRRADCFRIEAPLRESPVEVKR